MHPTYDPVQQLWLRLTQPRKWCCRLEKGLPFCGYSAPNERPEQLHKDIAVSGQPKWEQSKLCYNQLAM